MKPKQSDWFTKMNASPEKKRDTSLGKQAKAGLTKEDEIQIGLDLIPVWKEKEEELI